MKKKLFVTGCAFLLSVLMTGCTKEHIWEEATCTSPKICTECGITEGEALGHTWVKATCTSPKTCSVCGITEGEALGHTWVEATCTSPKTCSVCGITEGEALRHSLTEATYQSAAICNICGEAIGDPLPAVFEEHGIVCNADENIEYDYLTMGSYDASKETVGKVVFSECSTFVSDESHPAKEGYEWKTVVVSYIFDDSWDCGFSILTAAFDYYSGAELKNVLTYNGKEYTECEENTEILKSEWQGKTGYYTIKYNFLLPAGYDGIIISSINWKNIIDNPSDENGILVYIDDIDKDTILFRLK